MNGLDTSLIVTYLKPNDARLGALAAELIDMESDLAVGLVALVEAAYVLDHHYAVPRPAIVDALVAFVRKRNIHVLGADKALVVSALLGCRDSGRVSYADALIQVEAASHGLVGLYTFDRRFPRDGVPVRVLRPDAAPPADI